VPGIGRFCRSDTAGGIETMPPRKFVPPASSTAAVAPAGTRPLMPT